MSTMCKGFLFGNCTNARCTFRHNYMLCTRTGCTFAKCKALHLSHNNLNELKLQKRPFLEEIHVELNRLVYAYKSVLQSKDWNQLCAGKLEGGRCFNLDCIRCKVKQIDYPTCNRCQENLIQGSTFRLSCRHLLCQFCLDRVPVRVEAIAVHMCPRCGQYGHPEKLF